MKSVQWSAIIIRVSNPHFRFNALKSFYEVVQSLTSYMNNLTEWLLLDKTSC